MNPKDQSIITEDGQRLSLDNGEITGTEGTGPGLAFETGDTTDKPSTLTENNAQTDAPDE